MQQVLASELPPPLPGAYGTPPAAEALRPNAATLNLVRSQVQALLTSSPAFHVLSRHDQRDLAGNLVKIAAYTAELIRDDWCQSQRLGQRPVVRRKEVLEGPIAQAQAAGDEFRPAAANQIARVTQETLKAIAFPTFVADLIKGTFNAIVQASIQQMEAYSQLLANVGKTVDQFMADNISDNQARDWLAQMYPEHIMVRNARAVPRPGAEDRTLPNWRGDLNLSQNANLDEDSIEDILVPAARRKLAQSRLQLLSTMVLMGMNRIVVTGGKIRATMGFHIDTTDRAHEERATDLDFRAAAAGQFGFGPWSASASMSVSYVRSTRADSDAQLNVDADLTGEVDIRFKSDYFPLERFAGANAIGRIQANTAVPEANTPGAIPSGGNGVAYQSPRSRRTQRQATLRPIGSPLPESRTPVQPTRPATPPPGRERTGSSNRASQPASGSRGTSGSGSQPVSGSEPASTGRGQGSTNEG